MQNTFDCPLPEMKPFPVADETLLQRYENVFTAVVQDILDGEYDLHHQVLPSNIRPLQPDYKVAGFAFTIKGARSPLPEDMDAYNQRMARFIGSFPKNSFAVWDTSNDAEVAHYGEMMSYSSMSMGCRAAAVDGGARDIDRIIEMGFKVWCRYTTPRSMLGQHRIIAWQIPVFVGDVTVNPGDIVFGDCDGIVVVPREIAYDVLMKAECKQKEELGWRGILASGLTPMEAFEQGVQF